MAYSDDDIKILIEFGKTATKIMPKGLSSEEERAFRQAVYETLLAYMPTEMRDQLVPVFNQICTEECVPDHNVLFALQNELIDQGNMTEITAIKQWKEIIGTTARHLSPKQLHNVMNGEEPGPRQEGDKLCNQWTQIGLTGGKITAIVQYELGELFRRLKPAPSEGEQKPHHGLGNLFHKFKRQGHKERE